MSLYLKLAYDIAWMKYEHKICQFRLYFREIKLLAYFHIHHKWFCAVASSSKLRHSCCLCLVDLNNDFIFSFGGIPLYQKPNFIISE